MTPRQCIDALNNLEQLKVTIGDFIKKLQSKDVRSVDGAWVIASLRDALYASTAQQQVQSMESELDTISTSSELLSDFGLQAQEGITAPLREELLLDESGVDLATLHIRPLPYATSRDFIGSFGDVTLAPDPFGNPSGTTSADQIQLLHEPHQPGMVVPDRETQDWYQRQLIRPGQYVATPQLQAQQFGVPDIPQEESLNWPIE